MAETDFQDAGLDEALETAIEAARLAGEILMSWRDRFTVTEKSRRDVVTEADLESQQAIERLLKDRFPGHGLLGEEGLADAGTDEAWIL